MSFPMPSGVALAIVVGSIGKLLNLFHDGDKLNMFQN